LLIYADLNKKQTKKIVDCSNEYIVGYRHSDRERDIEATEDSMIN